MRLILFFDLPVTKASERKAATRFVKDIKKIGFYMLQESVYTKMCVDNHAANSTISKIKSFSPKNGLLAVLTVTEKQFASINYILGESITDVISTDERFIIL